jgi:hypothetical protein
VPGNYRAAVRVRRWMLVVLTVAVAVSFPLLVASAWRPEGEEPKEGIDSLIEDPANAVGWLVVAFAWVVALVVLIGLIRRRRQEPGAEVEAWDDEW